MPEFVHLHVHSDYFLFDGVSTLEELVTAAAKMDMRAMALTDHGNMMGAVHFVRAARKCGIKPIVGLEAYVALEDRRRKDKELDKLYYHLTLLAEDERGFRNLMTITSDAHLNGQYYKPRTDMAFLAEHRDGLVALSGCPKGEIPYVYINQGETAALAALKKYLDIFGPENFYIEIQSVGVEGYERVNRWLVDQARKNGLRVVATNDVHYVRKEDAYLQEILMSLNSNRTQDDERYIKTEQLYMRAPAEMAALFAEFPDALSSTLEIAERAGQVIDLDSVSLRLPEFPLPEGFSSPDDFLARLAEDGFRRKFGDSPPEEYRNRLKHELRVIKETGFASYFLIIWDIVEMARNAGVPVGPGRGSGAASLVLHCLDVTKIDPIRHNLLFERFLNPERISPPDVDIDFSDTKRDRVIDAIKRKYGEESVAQIVTYTRLKARAAVKDVARFYGLPYAEVDQVCKIIPQTMSLSEALREIPELSRIAAESEEYARVFETAKRLEGHIRNLSVHAAGVVITPGLLWEHVPLITVNSAGGEKAVVTQFDMKSLEDVGILKVDILGLRTLSVVERCLDLIGKTRGRPLGLDEIPLDDEKTFSLLARGDTASVFQLESAGMRRTLRNLNPTSIEDIFAVVALFRTGPLEAGMTDRYVHRKNGREPVHFPFPELEPILRDTYGVFVYQEQISGIAVALAGFTVGEADVLRYAIGKKKPELMAKMKAKFVDGAVARGHDRTEVEKIWDAMEEFAGYSFNRAHAASYGLLAYWTAYLKANYSAEFMTAALNAAIDSTKTQEKVPPLVDEARRMGITVLPPDINASETYFAMRDDRTILYGLAAIKNVGLSAISDILRARKDGPFTSLEDFMARVSSKVNKRVIESLIKAGAFDRLNPDRKALLKRCESTGGKTGGIGNGGFFVGVAPPNGSEGGKPDPEANTEFEKEVLGFYLTSSPLDRYPMVRLLDVTPSSRLIEYENGDKVKVVGVLLNITRQKSKKGNYFAQVNIEDTEGRLPGIIFSDPLKKIGAILREDKVYLFTGRVIVEVRETDDEEGESRDVKIAIEDAQPIEEVLRNPRRVTIEVNPEDLARDDVIQGIASCAKEHPGSVPIAFRLLCDRPRLLVSKEFMVAPEPSVLSALEGIVGKGRVVIA